MIIISNYINIKIQMQYSEISFTWHILSKTRLTLPYKHQSYLLNMPNAVKNGFSATSYK